MSNHKEAVRPPDGEGMPTAERELADDANWKVIQKNTFTRWTNEHLKQCQKQIADLEFDLADGLRLIGLVEVLSGKQFKHINKRPNFRSQKLENVSMALKFLEEHEGIKIVNIDSTDIVDSKLKLILGLIWTLILHYSISMPVWEGEDEQQPKSTGKDSARDGPTPKQRLLIWVQNRLSDLPVKNFTTDWNDGRAIGALVDAVGPGLCPDWQDWDPKQGKRNATEAMDLAEKWLDVPQLIRPEEMVSPHVDELSMMTYLSQFPSSKLNPVAPLRPRINAAKVRAYGPGVEGESNRMSAPAVFTVETFSAGRGEVSVTVVDSQGRPEPCEITFNNDRNLTYTCTYVPSTEGEYTIKISFAGKEIPKSPFNVLICGAAGDASKVSASGPGLESHGVLSSHKAVFQVHTAGAGSGTVDVAIVDPHGRKDSTKAHIGSLVNDSVEVDYMPKEAGQHTVHVYFAGTEIPHSPFTVVVNLPVDPKKCLASGRGIQAKGVRVKDVAVIKINTEGAGEAELKAVLVQPGGKEEPIAVTKLSATTYEATYVPVSLGEHVLNLTYGGSHISKSPFKVGVAATSTNNVRAYGPGLNGGIISRPAEFVVETNGEAGALGFAIEGPSETKIDCKDNGDGSADVSFVPPVTGEYAIHVLYNNEDILGSPFMSQIAAPLAEFYPERVVVIGPGLESSNAALNKPAVFSVNTSSAGFAPLLVFARDTLDQPIEVTVMEGKSGTNTCQFIPKKPGKHTLFVTYGGVNVPNSPFKVVVQEPSCPEKVKVFGPGISENVKLNEPTHFFVDCSDAGPGDIAISLRDESGQDVPVNAMDDGFGLFRIEYEPKFIGKMAVNVLFADKEVPLSPYSVTVKPSVDVSQIKVENIQPSTFLECEAAFVVDTRPVSTTVGSAGSSRKSPVKATVTCPSGKKYEAAVVDNGNGTYAISFVPHEPGRHAVEVTFEGAPLTGTPFYVDAVDGNDPSRVKAEGSGLVGGNTGQPQVFVVSTLAAGRGQLAVAVEGPSEASVSCVDNGDNTCTVTYVPTRAGTYDVSVLFGEKGIPGSPFKVAIEDIVDPSKCRAVGAGLNPAGVRALQPATFTVDCTEAGTAELQVAVTCADECAAPTPMPAEVELVGEGVYQVMYRPVEYAAASAADDDDVDGTVVDPPVMSVEVLYANEHVPGSPFKVRLLPSYDASLVRVSGPGIQGHSAAVASLPASFVVDARDAGIADIAVAVRAPDARYLKPIVTDNKDGTATVTYVPDEVGEHVADVQFGGKPVPGSPFTIAVVTGGDASKCRIQEPGAQKRVVVGKECVITVNTLGAGNGNVTCRIRTPSDTDADIDIQDHGDGTVSIHYTPKTPGAYQISIKFGGIIIPDGSYDVQAVPEAEALLAEEALLSASAADGLQAAAPQADENLRPVDFVIPVGPIFAYVTAEVHSPSGHISRPEIKDNGNGTITIYHQPMEVGRHLLYVSYNERHVQGSPYEFYVATADSDAVTAYGPGLSYGVAGQPCCFTVDSKLAGADGLAVAVEGPSKAEISYAEGPKEGTCAVTYSPTDPGLYHISVTVDGQHLSGSPFTAYVADKSSTQPTTGTASEISLSVKEYDIATLSASIIAPSGKQEPCILKTLANGLLGISFVPRETGQHLVNVFQEGGEHIANSPFKVNVTRGEVGDASKVKAFGDGLSSGNANEENFFTVDTRNAGYGGLSLTVEGPSKAEIDCKDQPDGTCLVSYKPSEPGTYVVNIKFADDHVPGSPFTCRIGGISDVKQTEELTAHQKALEVCHVGSLCELSLKVPGSDPMEMLASVTSPSRITELCDIHDQTAEHYAIKFVPKEMGVHIVCVKHKGLHIPGSPFLFTVGPITEGGSHKVHAAGLGLERSEADALNEFNVYTREAGPGSLAINVEGPSKAEIHFTDKKDGSCVVGYTCPEPGEYLVSVKFNDEHIPDSPFRVPVLPHSGEARKLTVQSLRQNGLEVGRPCAFTVGFNGAHGSLHARVVAPSGARDEALVQPLDDTEGHYAVRFIPRENGVHYVHVLLDSNHIRGSPFRILVGESDPDPGMLSASGDGLTKGETGRPSKFFVTTLGAGASTLSVTVDGPSKVKLQAKEASDGYEFTYTPGAPGDYLISVKYGGNYHIAGSPFKAHVTGSGQPSSHAEQSHCVIETSKKIGEDTAKLLKFNSDASKVTTKGLGLNKAFVMKKAQFAVDTSLAGNNMLFVGVVGPAGAPPCDEIIIKNAGGTSQYNISYTLKTKGKYLLIVKYGEEHVPGSPFHVDVV